MMAKSLMRLGCGDAAALKLLRLISCCGGAAIHAKDVQSSRDTGGCNWVDVAQAGQHATMSWRLCRAFLCSPRFKQTSQRRPGQKCSKTQDAFLQWLLPPSHIVPTPLDEILLIMK